MTFHVVRKSDQFSKEFAPVKTYLKISEASERVKPGNAILVHTGVYREGVAHAMVGKPGTPIVYMAFTGYQVLIKASGGWKPEWRLLINEESVAAAKLDAYLFGEYNPYHIEMIYTWPVISINN